MRVRAQRRRRLLFVDERRRQDARLLMDHAAHVFIRHCRLEGRGKMRQPLLGEGARDWQEIVAMFERQIGSIGIRGLAAEPLDEEPLLGLSLIREIAAEERAQRGVPFDAIVEAFDQNLDRGATAHARQNVLARERAMGVRTSQKAAVLHRELLPHAMSSNY
jgi:hypothetical protein